MPNPADAVADAAAVAVADLTAANLIARNDIYAKEWCGWLFLTFQQILLAVPVLVPEIISSTSNYIIYIISEIPLIPKIDTCVFLQVTNVLRNGANGHVE